MLSIADENKIVSKQICSLYTCKVVSSNAFQNYGTFYIVPQKNKGFFCASSWILRHDFAPCCSQEFLTAFLLQYTAVCIFHPISCQSLVRSSHWRHKLLLFPRETLTEWQNARTRHGGSCLLHLPDHWYLWRKNHSDKVSLNLVARGREHTGLWRESAISSTCAGWGVSFRELIWQMKLK